MLKTGDIIYKVTLEGYDIPCVVVKKYKVGQRLSKIDGTEGGGYLLKLAVRADQYLYLGDYIEDSEQTFVNLGMRPYSDTYIYVFDEKDIPKARKQILKNKIVNLRSELNYFKRRLDEENNEKNRFLVTVKVEDDATESAIYDEIVNTYIADDCEAIEQWIYDVTNIKVEEK